MTYVETDLTATISDLAGADLHDLTQAQIDGIDQFHSGGAEAVDRLIPGLGLKPGMTVLDVGSGLGGPARQIARSAGCDVVGVDITRAYVEAATSLTSVAGLTDRVQFVETDIATLERTNFDAAYTMHVQMNVADKPAFFTEIGRRLRPGAHLAVFEVCRAGRRDPALPLPWSIDGSDNFLATPADLRSNIESGGFTAVEWVDETAWILQWFDELGARLADADTAATLPALLTDGYARMLNFAAALADGILTVHRGAFRLVGR
ncbi:SAM-dependent methyltransferase [Aeromicrobium ginsengisoli]|uniref:Class I SAM-dependent methyltransferase n=1 Tax=Aeromicrobium ginsengisoli TaxID=363867 RepID=A0A5M4FD32_9ACTN|nr:class I SAM-dependent methyltransferase [Aeromicrobium ginsengisoli]KAA1397244.1 class I SAM-dependent methyltransferase [Aeromicrobium ginsengisoli]